ncbi:MAG: HlyD family efflux transporter periplasmic adaptor subunit [Ruminococcaceae bacterium]|nr:HlyD family efflux transporter periplasmic adaptor subunit [Oscillospiraceae bacterium]
MATVKKSNKKKIIIPICIVLVAAIATGSVFAIRAKTKVPVVSLTTITTDDIVESVSASGKISATTRKEYSAATVANCEEVFVKVGDKVKKGDKLATFNTSELDTQIASLKVTYADSKTAYNNAVKSQKEAQKKLDAVNKRIPVLEKQKAELEKKVTPTTTKKSNKNNVTKKNSTLAADPIIPGVSVPSYTEDIEDAVKALEELVTTINSLAEDIETTNEITRVVMQTISDELATGAYKPEALASVVGDAVADAIQQGLIDETKLIVESGVAVEMIEAAVSEINWSEIGEAIATEDNVQLTSVELQLAALYAEKELFSVSADTTVVNAQKQVMNTSKNALDTLTKAQSELKAGWIATVDGVVTECNVEAGMQTSALQSGIVIENLNELSVIISLGEYDVHKVSVGMPATIRSAYGTYAGEVVSIAPTATGGSSNSILDSVGSMAGISGLSSLTDSGAGVECVISVNEPDDNIIAGFEASVEIGTGTYSGVPTVPIESIILEKDGTYVYKYDEKEETVTKTKIETGATSDMSYEIKSGLSVGDKIVSTPASDYEEDSFKVRIN